MPQLRIIYDGECPFCSRYVQLMRLREKFDVDLVDARQEQEKAQAYGLDLNAGMIADLDGAVYHGAEAVCVLSRISVQPGLLSRRYLAQGLYPMMRQCRRFTLWALGRKRL